MTLLHYDVVVTTLILNFLYGVVLLSVRYLSVVDLGFLLGGGTDPLGRGGGGGGGH